MNICKFGHRNFYKFGNNNSNASTLRAAAVSQERSAIPQPGWCSNNQSGKAPLLGKIEKLFCYKIRIEEMCKNIFKTWFVTICSLKSCTSHLSHPSHPSHPCPEVQSSQHPQVHIPFSTCWFPKKHPISKHKKSKSCDWKHFFLWFPFAIKLSNKFK